MGKIALILLFPVWIGSAGYVFWVFQLKHYGFFQKTEPIEWDNFDQVLREELRKIPKGSLPMIVYFRDQKCLCSRYSDRRIAKIIGQYSEFRYVLVHAPGQDDSFGEDDLSKLFESTLSRVAARRLWSLLPAGPVVAVIDRDMRVAYFGPYESRNFCGGSKEGFVEATLVILRRGEQIQNINLWEKACFCPTRESIMETKRR